MPAVVEDAPGEGDRVADVGHARDGAVPEVIALHDGRIHLHGAGGGQDGAPAGIETRVVLQDAHGSFDGVEGGAASLEHEPAGVHGAGDAVSQLVGSIVGIGAGPAVDDQRRDPACHRARSARTMTP